MKFKQEVELKMRSVKREAELLERKKVEAT
jgi:hypothetical protein